MLLPIILVTGVLFNPLCIARSALLAPHRPVPARTAVLRAAAEGEEGERAPSAGAPSAGTAVAEMDPPQTKADIASVDPSTQAAGNARFTSKLRSCEDTDAVLSLVDANPETVDLATALHQLAALNKRSRAGRDGVLRDQRFERLIDLMLERKDDELNAHSVSDALWSFATLQHLPPTMLMPLLTALNAELDRGSLKASFRASFLTTTMWALAKLETKPVRLLEKIEAQAVPLVGQMGLQNLANLLWGCAALNYRPAPELLSAAAGTLLGRPEMMASAKPVEVVDIAFAFGALAEPGDHDELLLRLAAVASPDEQLAKFSSRQLVQLFDAYTKLGVASSLPDGLIDEWIAVARAAHESRPMMASDARKLEAALEKLGIEASWIARSEMLNLWLESVAGSGRRNGRKPTRSYTDDELRAAFDAIDADESGTIDRDELLTAIRAIKTSADEVAVKQMLEMADEDGSGEIDFDEFKQLMSLRQRALL